ncbi:hypothetical protein [Cryptosporidium parvum Iowa II]|uniref:Uncharacterized protein n=2 Tax=Cryptosporidium parvum TaxID=5807 RepID=Q5CYR5_CRYPI|nr:hypothetical protein [Cryptosporidium parvum Iowa II]EAK90187.1 hypothetical protein containing a signal peptide [Cryptosporidium parvum Iowa II]QOY40442.1 Protein kinase-like domain containing protein [Cryptosporidium parvum]WKS78811.1 signal peptide-containing protein [Cryptosporidium sp. 43IA8]WRK33295.1 Protein kinase-like domain containing protein [Cryptosporidium parvum]|eukprot:QOY40442.1 hypothetical protein CPATCC_003291 [Cryptosporidium parvum]
MRIRKKILHLVYSFCLVLCPITRSIYAEGSIRLFGLHGSENEVLLEEKNNSFQDDGLVVTMDKLRRINLCFIPEGQENTWYAPMVFYKRYKHLSQVYKKCSILRLKDFCNEFSGIIDCPKVSSTGELLVSSQGKEASTIFAMIKSPVEEVDEEEGEGRDEGKESDEGKKSKEEEGKEGKEEGKDEGKEKEEKEKKERFELFTGCVYELGKKSSLRVRCLHSNKAKKFPLKIVAKVDGRTNDFLYHFNHELIIYSRMASSTYGASKSKLHPSIYSVFLQPNRKMISRNVLLMEFIDGPAISSIISELIDYPNLLNYLKNRVNAILEESIRIYDSKFPSLRSDEKINVESKARLLENSINIWINNYTDKTIIFSVNLYRRLLYLLDLFHRGGTSFYPEELEDFSRGKWKRFRSFRIHCDFHQGNILVNISKQFKTENNVYNLTYKDILDIDFYKDLKIIDLEDAVELKESDFPVPIDKLVGTHPCPVYLTDAEGFSARLLSNIILISNTLSQTLNTLQDFFLKETKNLIFGNNIVSDWITSSNPDRISEFSDYSFKLKDSILKKLKIHSDNWDRYVDLITNDEVLKPCTSYYHLKYGRKLPPKSQLPCSWLSNILFSKKVCHYLHLSHADSDPSLLKSEDSVIEAELRELFRVSNLTKCHIEENEALNISINNVSSTIQEFLPVVTKINETYWGEWSALFNNQTFDRKFTNINKNFDNTNNEIGITVNSNSKKISDHNSLPCSNHLSVINSKSNMSRNGNKDKILKYDKNKLIFGSIDVPKEKNPSNVLDWVEVNQLVVTENEENNKNLIGKNHSKSEMILQNDTFSKEFDKILIDLMGLAALQRIISFCLKFSSEIDCDNVSSSKIIRDGPISSYIVRTIQNNNSTQLKNSSSDFIQFLDPCVLYSNETNLSNLETQNSMGWLCSKQTQDESLTNETVFKIIVDGRLFLNMNMTFVNQSNNTFAFNDVLWYFGINDTSKYTYKFNNEAVSMIEKHKKDALEFWKLESKIRNMDNIILNPEIDLKDDISLKTVPVLPKMFIFHSKLNTRKVHARVISTLEKEELFVTDKNLYFLPLSEKRSDLSKQISSIVQTGLLSENVFFMINPSNHRVSNLVSKVTNFQNEVFSMVWISYPTLVLSIIESILRSHSYQILISYRALEFLQRFRFKRDYDISIIRTPKNTYSANIQMKNDSKPVICNFSLEKIIIQPYGNNEILKILGELNKFTLYNTSGAKFMKISQVLSDFCSSEKLKNKSDIQSLIKDLVIPSLDPLFTLNNAVDTLSKIKYNSSIEVRRSNWFVKHVCSFISQKLNEINKSNISNEALPTLIQSLNFIIQLKNKIFLNSEFSKCINIDSNNNSNIEFNNNCTVGEYISISEMISSELLDLFIKERNIFKNLTSVNLAQELISYTNDHLQIPPPSQDPPFGGLGHLYKKDYNESYTGSENPNTNSTILYNRNKTIAFDVKWPIIANISDLISSEKNLTKF